MPDKMLFAKSVEIGPDLPTEKVIIELGEFYDTNYNPPVKHNMTPELLRQIAANHELRAKDVVIDYEHQTRLGVEAPAAGWINDVIFDPSRGLVSKFKEWTAKAQQYLKNKEYRFLSPVVKFGQIDQLTGKVIGAVLSSVALTNDPLFYWQEPLVSKDNVVQTFRSAHKEDGHMDLLKTMAEMMGLAADATPEQVVQAVKKMMGADKEDKPLAAKEVLDLLGAKADAKLDDIKTLVAKLKTPAATPDMGGYVARADYDTLQAKVTALESDHASDKALVASLTAERKQEKAAQAVEAAMLCGKITPAQKDWANGYALADPAGFAGFIAKAPQVVPLDKVQLTAKQTGGDILDDAQREINKQMGISQEDYKKYGQAAN